MTQRLTDEFLIEHRDRNHDQPSADLLSLRAAVRRVLEAQELCLYRRVDEANTDIETQPWMEAHSQRARALETLRAEMAGIDGKE